MKIIFFKIIFFLLLFYIDCRTPTIYKNFEQYRSEEEIAIIQMEGYELKLKDATDNYYDILYLIEGKYLIEFRDRISLMKGAALCEVIKGKNYVIKVIEKKEFPKHNKSVYLGTCIEKVKEEPSRLERYLLEKKLKDEAK